MRPESDAAKLKPRALHDAERARGALCSPTLCSGIHAVWCKRSTDYTRLGCATPSFPRCPQRSDSHQLLLIIPHSLDSVCHALSERRRSASGPRRRRGAARPPRDERERRIELT